VSPLRRRIVEADRLEPAEIEPGDGLADIVLDDAPQALIRDVDDAGGGPRRQRATQMRRVCAPSRRNRTAVPDRSAE
jgi:hypothetical protein